MGGNNTKSKEPMLKKENEQSSSHPIELDTDTKTHSVREKRRNLVLLVFSSSVFSAHDRQGERRRHGEKTKNTKNTSNTSKERRERTARTEEGERGERRERRRDRDSVSSLSPLHGCFFFSSSLPSLSPSFSPFLLSLLLMLICYQLLYTGSIDGGQEMYFIIRQPLRFLSCYVLSLFTSVLFSSPSLFFIVSIGERKKVFNFLCRCIFSTFSVVL